VECDSTDSYLFGHCSCSNWVPQEVLTASEIFPAPCCGTHLLISYQEKHCFLLLAVGILQGPFKVMGNAAWVMGLIRSNILLSSVWGMIRFSSCCVLWRKELYLGTVFTICWLIHIKNKRNVRLFLDQGNCYNFYSTWHLLETEAIVSAVPSTSIRYMFISK